PLSKLPPRGWGPAADAAEHGARRPWAQRARRGRGAPSWLGQVRGPGVGRGGLADTVGVACAILARGVGGQLGRTGGRGGVEQLGPLLLEQGLKEKQVAALARAIARLGSASAPARSRAEAASPASTALVSRGGGEPGSMLCCVPDIILMYMGSTDLLLKGTTFSLARGHRYGVVGRNSQKQKHCRRSLADGAIAELAASGLRFVHIRHEALGDEADLAAPAEHFARGVVWPPGCPRPPAYAEDPLELAFEEVGFSEELRRRPLRELSGGWRVRLLLATAVARRADVLLLDEPTNHLDSQAKDWLAWWLTSDPRGVTSMLVSHDRQFLDMDQGVCTDVIHFEDCQLRYYAGNFSRFQEQAGLVGDAAAEAVLTVRGGGGAAAAAGVRSSARVPAVGAERAVETVPPKMLFPIPVESRACLTPRRV
ncbi:unnamed protein product, partial [Prorocentrum cordatum]